MHEVSKRTRFRTLLKGGMSKAAISRELGISRRTATRWAAADGAGRGYEAWTYGPRAAAPSILDPYKAIVRVRLSEYSELSAERLFRELRESGYRGGYDVVKRYVRQVRPQPGKEPVVRFETPPGSARRKRRRARSASSAARCARRARRASASPARATSSSYPSCGFEGERGDEFDQQLSDRPIDAGSGDPLAAEGRGLDLRLPALAAPGADRLAPRAGLHPAEGERGVPGSAEGGKDPLGDQPGDLGGGAGPAGLLRVPAGPWPGPSRRRRRRGSCGAGCGS